MSTGSINNLASNYLQSIVGAALKGVTSAATSVLGATGQPSDNSQLSPFAQMLSELQQLQQSNPTQYQQVTQQIATNLQNAAKTATSEGNTAAATQLNQLGSDFTNASQNVQLPNISDLAQAIGGGHHHHHHGGHHASSVSSTSDPSSTSSTDSTDASNSSNPLQQLLAAFQTNTTQNDSLNPLSIITNTLASAGITPTNS